MATLNKKIRQYLEDNSKVYEDELDNFILQNDSDGNGDYIKSWNVSGLAKPSDSQLDSYNAAADTLETKNIAIGKRLKEYPSLGDIADAIFKKEAGDSTEFDELATKRAATKSKFRKS